jgi:hypothetical protein
MLISVIMPTRKRVSALLTSIDELVSLAKNPDDIEILLKVDSDDEDTLKILPWLPPQVKTLIYPRMRGYADLHIFQNDLAKIAQGKWLWIYNDDCVIKTQNWDEVISNYGDKFVVINPEAHTGHPCFPIVPRRLFEWWGHLSLSRQTDSWIKECETLGLSIFEPALWVHHNFDHNNITSEERDYSHTEHCSPELTYIREVVDMNILKEKLGL